MIRLILLVIMISFYGYNKPKSLSVCQHKLRLGVSWKEAELTRLSLNTYLPLWFYKCNKCEEVFGIVSGNEPSEPEMELARMI